MRSGFTLLEVLLASIILGAGLAAILVSMSQSQITKSRLRAELRLPTVRELPLKPIKAAYESTIPSLRKNL